MEYLGAFENTKVNWLYFHIKTCQPINQEIFVADNISLCTIVQLDRLCFVIQNMWEKDPSKLSLASTRGQISEYFRGVMESVNPKFSPSHKKVCTIPNTDLLSSFLR